MYDLVIIGAGAAGLTAGIYAGRFRLRTAILEKVIPGGRILLTESIENFPGFAPSVLTHDLIRNMEEQVRGLGVEIISEEVLGLETGSLEVVTQDNNYKAGTVIIASGAGARRLNVPGEEKLIGKGVSYCATCDGPFYKGKEVIVVGGGNTAIEEALYLARIANKVTLVHRRNELRGSRILQDKLRENEKIEFILNSVVTQISGTSKVETVTVKDKDTQKEKPVKCDGIFIYVGIQPHTAFLKGKLKTDEAGFIITDENLTTSHPAVFACGDCRKKSLYQMITACAEGAIAADSANKYLLSQKTK